jgi:hypothetical protein
LVFRTSFRGWRGPLRRPFQSDQQEALYTSRRFETAWLEAQQGLAFKAQPLTLVAYDVDCGDVADLTHPATCAGLGVSGNDLACAWEDLVSRGIDPPGTVKLLGRSRELGELDVERAGGVMRRA